MPRTKASKPGPGRPSKASKAAQQQQQPLSFGSRITKPAATTQTPASKAAAAKAAALISATTSPPKEVASPTPETDEVLPTSTNIPNEVEQDVKPAALAIRQQAQSKKNERTEIEEKALKVTEAQVKRYWKAKEATMKAPRGN